MLYHERFSYHDDYQYLSRSTQRHFIVKFYLVTTPFLILIEAQGALTPTCAQYVKENVYTFHIVCKITLVKKVCFKKRSTTCSYSNQSSSTDDEFNDKLFLVTSYEKQFTYLTIICGYHVPQQDNALQITDQATIEIAFAVTTSLGKSLNLHIVLVVSSPHLISLYPPFRLLLTLQTSVKYPN